MGASCLKAKNKPTSPPNITNSALFVSETNITEGCFSGVLCPIENLAIVDRKKSIDRQFPFSNSRILPSTTSLHQPQWRMIQIKGKKNGKYWYFTEKETQKLDEFGLLYFVGKNSQYMVEGNYKDNSIIPQEKYLKYFCNGSTYFGPLNSSFQPHGRGEIIYDKNEKYVGFFHNGIPHGYGQLTTKYSKFTGKFQKGQKIHGKLQEKHSVYEGSFRNNFKDGEGELSMENGQKYIGIFSKDKRNGYGCLYDASGEIVFEGMWRNDIKVN